LKNRRAVETEKREKTSGSEADLMKIFKKQILVFQKITDLLKRLSTIQFSTFFLETVLASQFSTFFLETDEMGDISKEIQRTSGT